MRKLKRREFIKLLGSSAAYFSGLGAISSCTPGSSNSGRIVIVGGGFGGSTCAKYLHRLDPELDITLVAPTSRFVTCPFSNTVLINLRKLEAISHGYDAHKKRGINIVHAHVQDIDAPVKKVTLDNGNTLVYDHLVLSPGIDFKWDEVEGMDASAALSIPHAWQGGPQTILLKKQLTAMPNGGVFIMSVPENPYRCPPGPYERASLVAHYLKQHKPKSKILILDAKDKFSKQKLFMQGWEALYPGMVEWVSGSTGGRLDYIEVENRSVHTEMGDRHKADVINLIPPQKAAPITDIAGLSNNDGWCPINQRSFESRIHANVHVIGDAAIAGKMPKSGFAANSQAKVCAAAIVSSMRGIAMPEPSYVNTCYSLVAPDYGISVAAVYRYDTNKGIYKVKGSGGNSPLDADKSYRELEARYAAGWYDSVTGDAFG
ncbi:MAG: NAD(P)/FAD-dependent oxidoreductase [Gammaproteobacteria bacterium]|nr:NAD(P)/FAD-dependent oxidoreductase [Gammaproteobacteria bacterium]